MPYLIGQLFGGIVITYLIMRLVMLAFRANKYKPKSIVISAGCTLLIATVIGGFGFADGGPPVFLSAFSVYGIPAVISMGIELFRVSRIPEEVE